MSIKENILFVCVGNTCRSIMIHSLYENIEGNNVSVFSAGIKAKRKEVSKNAKEILRMEGVTLSKDISEHVKDMDNGLVYDKLVILDRDIKISQIEGIVYRKLYRLDIEDPYDKDLDEYGKVYQKLKEELNTLK